ncbi:S locus-related glycoprotein 1 binding pollen coat protein [Arabidopsis thaliana x Arabidopsis arenosa]|uniref:Putative defensin-like protein 162 n=4 Tax=Arabidopsis TaxID=3701 RepID=DF162_ARATH|nr:low-molecular-weight cysteine-rich 37 [Arabidopsis thaliana]P82752.2 RecName: Full=Putative defensin-like protein 162; AltName: Full=Putative low-molecular-weight cysteine-rich protein 37; Short=Protein LCR37; Flags: Precursor [Arabidopsis thaliana]KAG7615775.1 S locus-related glycoprotein 1 binding pollen coat protein [Arabidopsis thaliana x Arabidopsis arenosa]KAG7620271.1 S locus-related glycoprotein 1 binding pollen coat protein [Arabidopsis suecica]AEE83230.1 low-molecular-weight cystei|eukprot:NP_001031623.1 low-molecular-weight cysteine-rich 37 [Arabidopsis thaliana]
MAKQLCSYMFISMFILSAFLALPSAEGGATIKKCVVDVKLSKPCTFQECQPLCLQKYNGNGLCPGDDNNICACVYNC